MRTHHTPGTHAPDPAALNALSAIPGDGPARYLAHDTSGVRAKRSIADLIDDQDALADWHRNVARLREGLKD